MTIKIFQDKIEEHNQKLKKNQEDYNNFKKKFKKIKKIKLKKRTISKKFVKINN